MIWKSLKICKILKEWKTSWEEYCKSMSKLHLNKNAFNQQNVVQLSDFNFQTKKLS